jgi:hypothetical protein
MRLLLLQPFVTFFEHHDVKSGGLRERTSAGDRERRWQAGRCARALLSRGDHRPAARAQDPRCLAQQTAGVGDQLKCVDADQGVGGVCSQGRIRSIGDDKRCLRAGHEGLCPSPRFGDRARREILPGQAGARHAREPQTDPATPTAQINKVISPAEAQFLQHPPARPGERARTAPHPTGTGPEPDRTTGS